MQWFSTFSCIMYYQLLLNTVLPKCLTPKGGKGEKTQSLSLEISWNPLHPVVAKQWWPACDLLLQSEAVICSENTEPWYINGKIFIAHSQIITLVEYFMYIISSNPHKNPVWPVPFTFLFWKWRNWFREKAIWQGLHFRKRLHCSSSSM